MFSNVSSENLNFAIRSFLLMLKFWHKKREENFHFLPIVFSFA
nr:MAG TPA: hypothetical protein [Bacteriophage sp.]